MRSLLLPTPSALTATTAVLGSVSLALSGAPAPTAGARADAAPVLLRAVTPPPHAFLRAALAAPDTYVVVAGDTVSGIAERFELATGDVLARNGLDWSSIIHPGDELTLSGAAATVGPAADASAPAATDTPAAAASRVVVAGDTLWAIAADAGVSLDALLAANALPPGAIIYPGQSLALPGPAESPAPASAPATASVPAADAPSVAGLDDDQIANARIIIRVGRERGVPDRGIAIALGTAMVESWIRNLDWGDRDSLGLFQQRPSTGWGTSDEILDPARAAAAFYGGPDDPGGDATRGLLDVPGWESLPYADAAQAVQVSAHPDRYAAWEQQAYAWLAALG
ncbi:MAG: LysM peptidoglycan-binding domain-containing protein [Microbacterium sp.]|uniref:LysM peptidoglycan-binding domain-containing protein n=1 Tax=Microbacterium sp. TaxID=51671 RepID=UPI001ACB9D93|nr:LysM peptidoglycan-binding domain-containing protein [Microbacterium sp.]MBN9177040.1 LysM peptidoglycan-binding domain-containing protein [Microbacterium sp.]